MAYYGVGLTTAIQEIIFRFRHHVAKANPYCTITRIMDIFKQYDSNRNGKLNLEELDAVLKGVGMYLKVVELQAIIKYFDRDGDKMLSFQEFLNFIREPMNERRRAMVLKVFDAAAAQTIDQAALKAKYLIEGLTEAMKSFINNINVSPQLNFDSFVEFHEQLSMNVAVDETFTQLLSKAWKIDEKQEDTAFQELLENSIVELKERILRRAGGPDVMKVFTEFDLNKSGDISIDEFLILLKKLELQWPKAIINRVYQIMDRNKSQHVEREEFVGFFGS